MKKKEQQVAWNIVNNWYGFELICFQPIDVPGGRIVPHTLYTSSSSGFGFGKESDQQKKKKKKMVLFCFEKSS